MRLLTGLTCMDVEGVGPLPERVAGALEADALNGHIVQCGGMLHEAADAVVGDGMHDDFFTDHRRGFATQDIHAHGDLDVAEEQLNGPAPEVQLAEPFGRPFHRVEQGRG